MTNSAALQNRDRRTRLAEARVVAVQARPRGGGSTTVHWQGPVGLSPPARDGHDRRLAVTMVSVSEAAMLRSTAGAQGPVTRLAMAPDAVQLIGSTEPRGRLTADATGARGVVSTGDLTAMAGAAKPRTGHAAGFFGRAATPARPDGFGFGDSAARVANAPAATLLGPGSTRAAAGGPGSAGATGTAVGTGATAQSGAMSGDAGASPAGDGGQASTQASGGNGGHVQGDVYFDGALMGRWMSRALAREAARPPAGGAAFDARRNPLPTGRMIGG